MRIGGLDVRVRARDDADPAVEVIAEGELFAGRLGVKIHRDYVTAAAQLFDGAVGSEKGILRKRHRDVYPADKADYADPDAGGGF